MIEIKNAREWQELISQKYQDTNFWSSFKKCSCPLFTEDM